MMGGSCSSSLSKSLHWTNANGEIKVPNTLLPFSMGQKAGQPSETVWPSWRRENSVPTGNRSRFAGVPPHSLRTILNELNF